MKRMAYFFCGLCWLVFGTVAGIFLWQYIASGSGAQDSNFVSSFFSPVSSGSIAIGLIHALGFFMVALLCIVIGTGLCLHSLEPRPKDQQEPLPPR